MTTFAHFYAYAPNVTASNGTCVNSYGLYIEDQTAVNITNAWSIYAVKGTAHFGSDIQIGGTDAGISRLGAASLAIGNGTKQDVSGKLTMANLNVGGLAAYISNALAILGGLAAGDFYRTGADPDVVCVVH